MRHAHANPAGAIHWPAFAAVAAATGLGWAALIAIGATGIEAICGGSGLGLAIGTTLMWGLMAATMMLPCVLHEIGDAAHHGWRAAARHALGCIALPTMLAIAAGGLLTTVALAPSMLVAIAGFALAGEALWEAPVGNRLGSAVAMVCLQLVGGAMELGWMALVAIWMLALALAPARRAVTAAAGIALLAFAAFGSL
jgi:predicted metal-binding membrane protein